MNYMFWIKKYNTIYIFWSYSNQKVIFWFIIVLLVLLVHGTAGKCGFEPYFLHSVCIKIYLIIFNSYNIVMTGYMHTMLVSCVLNNYVSLYKFIFIIYLSLTCPALCDSERSTARGLEWMCRALAACANTGTWRRALIVVVIWAYSFIPAWLIFECFSEGPVWIYIYKWSKFFALSFPRI